MLLAMLESGELHNDGVASVEWCDLTWLSASSTLSPNPRSDGYPGAKQTQIKTGALTNTSPG